MNHQIEEAIAYLLTFLNAQGQERSLVLQPIDAANGVVLEETFDGSGWMRGRSFQTGKEFELKLTQVLMVEEYKVRGNWGGNGHKTVKMTGEQIADYTKNSGGEAGKIAEIRDSSGKVVYDKNDRGSD